MGLQRVRHNLVTKQHHTIILCTCLQLTVVILSNIFLLTMTL